MIKKTMRDLAVSQLNTAWEYMYSCIENGCANTINDEYEYSCEVFNNSLEYIQRCDFEKAQRCELENSKNQVEND
jgi:hypothetical protein